MIATAKRLMVIGLLALLSSCSPPPIDVSVDRVDGRLRFTLSQDWGFLFSDRQTPCLRELGLYKPGSYDRQEAVWLIEAKGDVQCLDLASVVVGEVPGGWRQVVGFSPVRGRTYTLRAQGIGWGETSVSL